MPDEVLLHVGLTEEDIHETHLRNKKQFGQLLTTALMDIASMSEEELQAAGLKEEEIKAVYDMAGKGKAGDVKSVLAAVSTHGEFHKGIEWPLASMKDYWMEVANGERQVGDEYKKNGEELAPEKITREEEEAEAAKEAREAEEQAAKEAEEAASADAANDDAMDIDDGEEKKKPEIKTNPFDKEQNEHGDMLEVPDNAITEAANHSRLESAEAALGGR